MQVKFIGPLAILMLALLVGCEKPEQNAEKPAPDVFATQKQELDQAKQVEGVIMQGEQRQREAIDQQAR